MQEEFEGKGVVVTGGASGIGASVVRAFVHQGARVFIGDINECGLSRLDEELSLKRKGTAGWSRCDVSCVEDVVEFISQAAEFLCRVDVLVNCAGVVSRKEPEEITPEAWERTLAVNLRGTFLMCQQVLPLMKKQRGGSIVNISSLAVRVGGITTGADYVASKGGINALTLYLAKKYAPAGIRVNAVSPRAVNTAMMTEAGDEAVRNLCRLIPMGRLGEPKEVAEAVLFLASERASYITGAVLEVTGGL